MKKSINLSLGLALALGITVFPTMSYADEEETEGYEKVSTEEHEVAGEEFNLEKWQNPDGTTIYTIPTEVENKEEITDYVDEITEDSNESTPFKTASQVEAEAGVPIKWSYSGLSNTDSGKAKIVTGASGYSNHVVNEKMAVNKGGKIEGWYLPNAVADSIKLRYSYNFSGTVLSISKSPSLTMQNSTVSWAGPTIKKQFYSKTSYEPASASGIAMFSTTIKTSAEVVKGGIIYRPSTTKKISFGGSGR